MLIPKPNEQTRNLLIITMDFLKGDGSIGRNGIPKNATRSNWIKANPSLWAQIQDQWTKQDIYRIQKEGASCCL
jgi:hypothetical protein